MLGLISVPSHLGYPVLAVLVGVESTGVPVPGETALITAALLASGGRLEIALVIAVASAAAIIGDNIGYLIGRKGGRSLLERPGLLEGRRRRVLEAGEPFFERHGPKAVFLGRWVAGLRIAAAWLAGINRMPWPTFIFWNALGGIAWATSVGLAAYYLGPVVGKVLELAGLGAVGVLAVAALGYFVWRRRHRRERTS